MAQVLEWALVLVLEWASDQVLVPAPVQGLEWGSAWESVQMFEWVSVEFVLVQVSAQVLEWALVPVLEWAWDQMVVPTPVQALEWGRLGSQFSTTGFLTAMNHLLWASAEKVLTAAPGTSKMVLV